MNPGWSGARDGPPAADPEGRVVAETGAPYIVFASVLAEPTGCQTLDRGIPGNVSNSEPANEISV